MFGCLSTTQPSRIVTGLFVKNGKRNNIDPRKGSKFPLMMMLVCLTFLIPLDKRNIART